MNRIGNQRSSQLIILGAGGLGSEFLWVAEEMNQEARHNGATYVPWEILGFADDDSSKKDQVFSGHLVHGSLRDAFGKFGSAEIAFAVAIGSNQAREKVARQAEEMGWRPIKLIHPSTIVAGTAAIGPGSYLAPGTVVCPGARIGRHVIINTHVSIGHDSALEDFVQVCPGARVSGGCQVGKGGFLGSNASLAPLTVVGEDAVVGANSFVVRKVAPRTTVLGCPALTIGRTRL